MSDQTLTKSEYCPIPRAKWLKEHIKEVELEAEQIDPKYDPYGECNKYLTRVLKTDGNVPIMYKKSKHQKKGRWFANIGRSIGCQNLAKEFRHTLFSEEYVDVDAKNCHPTLLEQYCKKNDIPCACLSDYNLNRDAISAEFEKQFPEGAEGRVWGKDETTGELKVKKTVKSHIKQMICRIINGGALHDSLKRSKAFKALYKEVKNIIKRVNELNPDLVKLAKKSMEASGGTYNPEGKTMGVLLCMLENRTIMEAHNYFMKNGFSVDVLCFDGFQIRKVADKIVTTSHLKKCSEYVEEVTGYRLEFAIKAMTKGKKLTEEDLKPYTIKTYVIDDDREGITILLNEIGDRIKYADRSYYLKRDNMNIYEEDISGGEKYVKNLLVRECTDLYIMKEVTIGDSTELKPYSRNYSGASAITKGAITHIKEDQTFKKKLWESNLLKLCFKDGYYCFTDKKFKPYDKDTISPIYIKKEFPKKVQSDIDDVYAKILDPIFRYADVRDKFLNWSARSIAGHWDEKTWSIGTGLRNCGKNILQDLFRLSFEDYTATFNTEEIMVLQTGSGDISKKLGWTIDLEYVRLAFSSEMRVEDANGREQKIDANIIKSLTGGDERVGRRLYGHPKKYTLQTHFMMFMNRMANATDSDCFKTLEAFTFTTEFIDGEVTEELEDINELGEFLYLPADLTLKSKYLTQKRVQNAFIHIILESYTETPMKRPSRMYEYKEDIIGSIDELADKINSMFEFTKNMKDYVTIEEANKMLSDRFFNGIHKNTFKLKLKSMGAVEGKAGANSDRVYRRIKAIVKKDKEEEDKAKEAIIEALNDTDDEVKSTETLDIEIPTIDIYSIFGEETEMRADIEDKASRYTKKIKAEHERLQKLAIKHNKETEEARLRKTATYISHYARLKDKDEYLRDKEALCYARKISIPDGITIPELEEFNNDIIQYGSY